MGMPEINKGATPQIQNESRVFYPPYKMQQIAHIRNYEQYKNLYDDSIENPEHFWDKQASLIDWINPYKEVYSGDQNFSDFNTSPKVWLKKKPLYFFISYSHLLDFHEKYRQFRCNRTM
jgi:hypothetical protein